VVSNGSFTTQKRGLVRRFICRECGLKWDEDDAPSSLLNAVRFNDSEEALFQSFALLAVSETLDGVEGLANRKSETIRTRLLRCYGNHNTWERVLRHLIRTYGISRREAKQFSAKLKRIHQGHATFHSFRDGFGKKLKTKRARLSLKEIVADEILRSNVLKARSAEEIKIRWQRLVRRCASRALRPMGRRLHMARERLKLRVEHILGCAVVDTPDGVFYRFDNDQRVNRWIQQVKGFDARNREWLIKLLPPFERSVFDKIRCPSDRAHALARLEGARRTKFGTPPQELMTPYCLAEGAYYGLFIQILKQLAQFLRRMSRQ
jgi:hypothetical protein